MATAIEIVPYEARHARGIVDLIGPIQQGEFGLAITIEQQPDLTDIDAYYRQGAGNFWVAQTSRGRVVGSIALKDIGHGQAALRKMFVDADHRGAAQGVAQGLLDTLFAWARDHGLQEVYLGTTEAFRAAHRFYEKNGFRAIAREHLPAGFPLMDVDTRFYRRAVSPQ